MKPIRKNLLQMKTVSAVRLAMLENIAMQVLLADAERALQKAEPLSEEARGLLWYFEASGVDTVGLDDNDDVQFRRTPLKNVENLAPILQAAKILPPDKAVH